MITIRLFAGALFIAGLASVVLGGNDGSAPTFPSPSVIIRDAPALTNAPTAAMATVVPEPALPQVTVPKPAQVDIPSATAVQSGPAVPAAHPQPILPPTGKSLVSKSMQSGPGGMQEKLAAIVAPPALTNANTTGSITASSSPLPSTPVTQSNVWEKTTPSLNGINYHW